jgi:hypothetical protein
LKFHSLHFSAARVNRLCAVTRRGLCKFEPSVGNEKTLLVLKAMQHARFSIIICAHRNPVVGLAVKDPMLATRLYPLQGFTMTAGVLVGSFTQNDGCLTKPFYRCLLLLGLPPPILLKQPIDGTH